jgi:hypothetical protein
MKKVISLIVAFLLIVSVTGIGYAQWLLGYEVVNVTEQHVKIKSLKGEEIEVPDESGEFKKGQDVMYDKKKNKIRKRDEGC